MPCVYTFSAKTSRWRLQQDNERDTAVPSCTLYLELRSLSLAKSCTDSIRFVNPGASLDVEVVRQEGDVGPYKVSLSDTGGSSQRRAWEPATLALCGNYRCEMRDGSLVLRNGTRVEGIRVYETSTLPSSGLKSAQCLCRLQCMSFDVTTANNQ